ncbi:17140_t:CDS:2, partial [Racocetra fulgida]
NYAHPSFKQKEDALFQIISSVGILPASNDHVPNGYFLDGHSVTKPFRPPLLTKKLLLHINATKPIPTLG